MKLKWKIFLRTVFECFKRSVTPFMMYMFCSMTALACLNLENKTVQVLLVAACILFAVALNVDLGFNYGKKHYQMYLSGNIRRNNDMAIYDNTDRKSYQYEMEYRPYKGFVIGLFICIPVVIVCLFYALFGLNSESGQVTARLIILLVSGWAILPWEMAGLLSTPFLTLLSCLLPVLVTGIFYILGAKKEEKDAREREARMQAVMNGEKESNRQKKKREREKRNF